MIKVVALVLHVLHALMAIIWLHKKIPQMVNVFNVLSSKNAFHAKVIILPNACFATMVSMLQQAGFVNHVLLDARNAPAYSSVNKLLRNTTLLKIKI